jgi:hypothetical protein
MSSSTIRVLALCTFLSPLALPAQSNQPLVKPGDVVRLVSSPDAERLTVEQVTTDSLFLRHLTPAGDLVAVALKSLTTLEVRRQGSRQGGALGGALLVGGIGAAAGVLFGFSQGDDPQGIFSFTKEEKAMILGGVGGLAGAAIGAIVGSSQSAERWEPVALHGGVGLARMRGGALAVTYSMTFR